MSAINTNVFEPRFLSGLVFAMIEGLKNGENLDLIFENNPEDLHLSIGNASLSDLNYRLKYDSSLNKWVMSIGKKSEKKQEHGCCGICGHHS